MGKSQFFTTKEVAKYLKINEKKVYQLIKEGEIPCTRVAGKWLFPKHLIDEWIAESIQKQKDVFIAGSNDPFLNLLINKYNKDFFPDSLIYYACIGSARGLEALAKGKAVMAATHLFDPETQDYNLPFLSDFQYPPPACITLAEEPCDAITALKLVAKSNIGAINLPGTPASTTTLGVCWTHPSKKLARPRLWCHASSF